MMLLLEILELLFEAMAHAGSTCSSMWPLVGA